MYDGKEERKRALMLLNAVGTTTADAIIIGRAVKGHSYTASAEIYVINSNGVPVSASVWLRLRTRRVPIDVVLGRTDGFEIMTYLAPAGPALRALAGRPLAIKGSITPLGRAREELKYIIYF
jgi:hypothetical protein